MKKGYQLLLCFVLLLISAPNAWAQFTVTGTVTDASTNEALIGANIYHEASEQGATTDENGQFSIDLPNQSATLRISYIGYVTQNVEVSAANNEIQVALKPDIANLDELVVTGLVSSVKRSNLANAVASINAEDIAGQNDPQTLDNALYGEIPGVNIISQSGAPGGGFNVQLRGVSTLGAGSSQPLYIIDGVYVNNSNITTGRSLVSQAGGTSQDDVANRLADINPDDIESVEVLKGASAAAIYGQRANAGVIIITTKKGSGSRTNITFQQDVGFGSALRFLGRTEWNEDRIRAFWGDDARGDLEIQRFNDAQSAAAFAILKESYTVKKG